MRQLIGVGGGGDKDNVVSLNEINGYVGETLMHRALELRAK